MKAVLHYPGAKHRIAPWICSYIPDHTVYLEPFAGSLAVLFNKSRSHIETVNDLDGDIVNFFMVVRDREEDLERLIKLTLYSREEYRLAYDTVAVQDDVERARRFCVKCWMGFGCGNLYQNGFKSGQQTHSPNPAKEWAMLPDTIEAAAERLQGVQIENLPAADLISRYDTKDVFIYADPPYLHSTRKGYLYKHEMSDRQHIELLEILLQHPGKVMISAFDNDLYDDILCGWNKVQKNTLAEGGRARIETLYMNYDPPYRQISFV